MSGSLNQSGIVVGTGSQDHQPPITEDLSGSGNAYYPVFHGLERKTIPVKHTKGVPTKISFINSEAKSMHVNVSFPGTATGNLRLSQIVMPDGNMDGPFGTDMTVNLAQLGGYELRFTENQMSGDPWSGNAIITISLAAK